MIKLLQNENMKIYNKIGTWVMVAILLMMVTVMGFLIKEDYKEVNNEDWREEVSRSIEHSKTLLKDNSLPKSVRLDYEKDIAIKEYRLENDITPNELNTLWGFVVETTILVEVISVFVIIVAAGILANEFSSGTIKLLLTRPISRGKIMLSKYLASFVYALFMILILFLYSFILGSFLFGFESFGNKYLLFKDGTVTEVSILLHIFDKYLLNSVSLLLMVTFAFMLSSIFKNNAFSIGISIFLLFVGQNIVLVFSDYNWVKYILFANTNLAQYTENTPIVEGMTLEFSLIVLAIYFLLFNFISWLMFTKRDIVNE